jgi:hypothetical protein
LFCRLAFSANAVVEVYLFENLKGRDKNQSDEEKDDPSGSEINESPRHNAEPIMRFSNCQAAILINGCSSVSALPSMTLQPMMPQYTQA